jgi:hypothetical protein
VAVGRMMAAAMADAMSVRFIRNSLSQGHWHGPHKAQFGAPQ